MKKIITLALLVSTNFLVQAMEQPEILEKTSDCKRRRVEQITEELNDWTYKSAQQQMKIKGLQKLYPNQNIEDEKIKLNEIIDKQNILRKEKIDIAYQFLTADSLVELSTSNSRDRDIDKN